MGKMDPCSECGGELKPTMAPLWGWRCPACRALFLPKAVEELNKTEGEALLKEYDDALEFWRDRAAKTEARIAELEAYIKKTQPMMDAYLAPGMSWNGKWVNDRAEDAELALRKIKEAHEARSELFTSDAECAQNMADWATLALKERGKP
jgi:hypothetical protein